MKIFWAKISVSKFKRKSQFCKHIDHVYVVWDVLYDTRMNIEFN